MAIPVLTTILKESDHGTIDRQATLVFKAEGGDEYNGAKTWVAVHLDEQFFVNEFILGGKFEKDKKRVRFRT
ncbi:hypothetical protein M8R19_27350 [Pseudomonas sp. R3.Fl]|uniref:hypothetical protein n=1 Tax=Pseudomonas sp. R3.Fl TaxID=2928708 RepID=UPI00201E1609|nr:hypothetical protein [Pseudomonas sp. R3.Fl]MCL6692409.1 hypothetical protein [Pseudomonas sp. R3.Fl]